MEKSTISRLSLSIPKLAFDRVLLARLLGYIAIVLMVIAAVGFHPASSQLILSFWIMVAGGGVLGLAPWLHPGQGIPQPLTAVDTGVKGRVRWLPFSTGIALLVLLSLRSGKDMLLPFLYHATPVPVQAVILFSGIGLIVAGAGGLHRADLIAISRWLRVHRRELLLVGLIALIAFAVRTYNLENNVRAFMDEGPFIASITTMRQAPTVPLIAPMHDVSSFTRLFAFSQLMLTDVLGSTLGVFRLAPVLYGVLTVAATYALARLLFDKWTAILAACFLAVFPPHIHLSRIGINNIADPLFGVMALVFLTRAVQTKCRLWYVLAGAMVGLLPYFYEGGELLFPPLLVLWAGWLVIAGPARPARRGMLWLGLIALLIALPVYYTNSTYDLALFTRLNDRMLGTDYWIAMLVAPNGLSSLTTYFNERLVPPLLHYIHAPDPSLFYSGQTPLILTPLLPLALLGFFHALWRPRAGGMLLVIWILLTALGNSVISYNNWTVRFVVVMPAVAILLAIGLRYTLPLLGQRGHGWIFAGFILIAAIGQVTYYFGPHMTYYREQIMDLRRHYDVIFRVKDLPEDTQVYHIFDDYVQTPFSYAFLEFLGDAHFFRAEKVHDIDLLSLNPDRSYAFFVNQRSPQVVTALEAVWDLDGPYFGDTDVPVAEQYALYKASRWLWHGLAVE